MLKIRFVTPRDDHGAPVAGTDVGKCHEYIDLTTIEGTVVIAKLCPLGGRMAARMQTDGVARPSDAGEDCQEHGAYSKPSLNETAG